MLVSSRNVQFRSLRTSKGFALSSQSAGVQTPYNILTRQARRMSGISVQAITPNPAGATVESWPPVVSPKWLSDRLHNGVSPEVSPKVLAAPWYMAVHGRDARAEFQTERVPGALFFDIDGVADITGSAKGPGQPPQLPHMLPSAEGFAAAMDALGISNDTPVVVYDHLGVYSAPRVWFTFRAFGHQKISVLAGGLPAWKAAGLPLEPTPVDEETIRAATTACQRTAAATAGHGYVAKLDSSRVRSLTQMLENVASGAEQVVDARSAGRFRGEEPEPRAGLRGGHIPGSKSLAFPNVLENSDGLGQTFKSPDALRSAFEEAGVDLSQPRALVASCGSGLTASILALAAHIATEGRKEAALYDGSWMEWGARDDTPVATGEP